MNALWWTPVAIAVALYLGFLILRQSRFVGNALILALLYGYTFHGFVLVWLGRYDILVTNPMYLGGAPYDVNVHDELYWMGLLYLSLFAVSYLLAYFLAQRAGLRGGAELRKTTPPFKLGWLIAIGAGSLFVATAMWFESLRNAIAAGQSIYIFFKRGGDLGVWYPISRVLFDLSGIALGAAFGQASALVTKVRDRRAVWGFLVALGLLLFQGGVMAVLGDRSTLVTSLLVAVMFASWYGVSGRMLAIGGIVALTSINIISRIREPSSESDPRPLIVRSAENILVTGESTVALSMYTALRHKIPGTNGGAIYYLAEIMVPQFIRPERTGIDPVVYYSNEAGLPPQTGWGIHFATDLLLNFGLIGILLGSAALGAFHAGVVTSLFRRPEFLFVAATCIGAFPLAFRAGVTGLKTTAIAMIMGYFLTRLTRSSHATPAPVPRPSPTL